MLDPKTPWDIAKWNIIAYWVAQALLWALMFFAIKKQPSALLIIFWVNVGLPVLMYWTIARQCRTAYLDKEPDEIRDFAVPAVVVFAVCAVCYFASRG